MQLTKIEWGMVAAIISAAVWLGVLQGKLEALDPSNIREEKEQALNAISAALSKDHVMTSLPDGFGYLTMKECVAGFRKVEDGYIKLGKSGYSLHAEGSNQKEIAHRHGSGELHAAIVFGGDKGKVAIENRRSGKPFEANHILALPGEMQVRSEAIPDSTVVNGNTAEETPTVNVEPRHVTLRLCIKQQG